METQTPAPGEFRAAKTALDRSSAERLAALFSALADPNRVRLISLILDKESCVHELASAVNMSQSAVSHQLRILRNLRIARNRKRGRHIYYRLDDDHVRELFLLALQHLSHSGRADGPLAGGETP
jgi:DNA-binding transcriptional ArsR family regulator